MLAPREPRSSIEKLPHFAGRTGATPFGRAFSEQFLDADAQHPGQLLELLRPQRYRVAFPVCIGPLGHSQALSHLLLRKPGLFAQCVESGSERRALLC